jgi:hypothetical protein
LEATVTDLVHAPQATSYWKTKKQLEQNFLDQVHWHAIDTAIQEIPRARRVFVAKHNSGFCGVGKILKRRNPLASSSCPRCGQFEDAQHVWLCQAEACAHIWEKSLQDLSSWMESCQTDPLLHQDVISYLKSWRSGSNLTLNYESTFSLQHHLGCNLFFQGFVTQDWEQIQDSFYNCIKSRRTGYRWLVAFIKKMWNIAWDLWEHRNGVLHSQQNDNSTTALRSLKVEIRKAYFSLSSRYIAPVDQHLLHLSLVRLQQKEFSYLKEWLRQATVFLKADDHRRDTMMSRMRLNLRRWLKKN